MRLLDRFDITINLAVFRFCRMLMMANVVSWRCHRIDTRPEGTLLCVLAEGKRPEFFTCYDVILKCTRHFVPMFGLIKTSVCTPGWRHMMAYFQVSTRKISNKISSEWHLWSSIYSVTMPSDDSVFCKFRLINAESARLIGKLNRPD
jgi:hypothetical protein